LIIFKGESVFKHRMKVLKMGNHFLMALYRPSEALLDQIFMQRWGLADESKDNVCIKVLDSNMDVW
jgi:hypothetical protein